MNKDVGEEKKVLVTGGSGLIGRNVILSLIKSGAKVVAVYNTTAPPFCHENLFWLHKNLLKESVDDLLAGDIDAVVHCAAVIPTPEVKEEDCYNFNTLIDNHVIVPISQHPTIKIIYLSSIYIEDYLRSSSGKSMNYFQAKLRSEQMLASMPNRSTVLRISSPYGIGQRTNNVLKIFIDKVVKGEDISIFGKGTRTQDFISASDIALAVTKSIHKDIGFSVLNVCSSSPVSMKDLAFLVKLSCPDTGTKIIQTYLDDPQENYRASFENWKTKELLNWHPIVSLEGGIRECIQYLIDNR